MSIYLKSVHIKKLFHLSGIDINVCEAGKKKHLLITGPNGTGKTLLLGAIVDYLEKIAKDPDLLFLNYEKYLKDNEDYTSKSIAHQITVFNSFFNYIVNSIS